MSNYQDMLNTVTQKGVVYLFDMEQVDVDEFRQLCDQYNLDWEFDGTTFRVKLPPTPEEVHRAMWWKIEIK